MSSAVTDARRGSLLLDATVVLGGFLLAAVAVCLVWPQLVDPVTVTRTEVGTVVGEAELGQRFDKDAWYVVLAAVAGLVLGIALTAWRRSHEVATVLLVAAAACLAAWISAVVGTWAGPEDPERLLARAEVGTTAPEQVRVDAPAAYLVWPIAAVTGALVVLWRPLDRG
jgi:MFS superfamily sulfate permease-like transporter